MIRRLLMALVAVIIAVAVPGVARGSSTVDQPTDLAVGLTADTGGVWALQATVTLTVTNNGPSDVTGVVVDLTTYTVEFHLSVPPNCQIQARVEKCTIGPVPVGGTGQIIFTAFKSGTSVHPVGVGSRIPPDLNPANNQASDGCTASSILIRC